MEKIPTIFERGADFLVTAVCKNECLWVFNGEGVATEKLDGTNVRLTVQGGQLVKVEKRRNPTKAQKEEGIVDGWYVDAVATAPEDKWICEAARNTDVRGWPDGAHSAEAVGPRIQGGPLGFENHLCIPFHVATQPLHAYPNVPRVFDALREFLRELCSLYSVKGAIAEGIVFHHPDGRMAKIKRKDFWR